MARPLWVRVNTPRPTSRKKLLAAAWVLAQAEGFEFGDMMAVSIDI
jgi:hypothetical protein